MNKEFIDDLTDRLATLDSYLYDNSTNSLEKINIVSKLEELMFWLQMYSDKYFESDTNE